MAQWHLDEIRAALEKRGWRLTAELPGNDYNISATWQFERHGDGRRRGANDPEARERWLNELATFADAASGARTSSAAI